MKAMILAAGRGERLRPLTLETPKPLLRVGGKPLIQWHLERLAGVGIREVVINTAWLGEQIEQALGDGGGFGLSIRYAREETPMETLGGLRHALPLLEGGDPDFLVINGDVWSDFDIARLLAPQEPTGSLLATLVLVPNPPHREEGDFILADSGRVFGEGDGARYTFSGISRLNAGLVRQAPPEEQRLGPVLKEACRQGLVRGLRHDGAWFDVGTHERLAAANAHAGQYEP